MVRDYRTAEEHREGSCRFRKLKKDRREEGGKERLRTCRGVRGQLHHMVNKNQWKRVEKHIFHTHRGLGA